MPADYLSEAARAQLTTLDRRTPTETRVVVTRLDIPWEDIVATVLKVYAAVVFVSLGIWLPVALIVFLVLRSR